MDQVMVSKVDVSQVVSVEMAAAVTLLKGLSFNSFKQMTRDEEREALLHQAQAADALLAKQDNAAAYDDIRLAPLSELSLESLAKDYLQATGVIASILDRYDARKDRTALAAVLRLVEKVSVPFACELMADHLLKYAEDPVVKKMTEELERRSIPPVPARSPFNLAAHDDDWDLVGPDEE